MCINIEKYTLKLKYICTFQHLKEQDSIETCRPNTEEPLDTNHIYRLCMYHIMGLVYRISK